MVIAEAILREFPELNEAQREAVGHTEGPLLVIAGPGSGKTLVLVVRALNVLLQGLAEPREVLLCNLPLLTCKKTIFNYVATYNDYEKAFARFLERCQDILRFASLGTTEQETGTRFRVDYLKPSGAIGFYYPDWVAVQKTEEGEVNWIIETKGRVWEDTLVKDAAITDWCKKVSKQTGKAWRYLRVNQPQFGDGKFPSFLRLLEAVTESRKLPL